MAFSYTFANATSTQSAALLSIADAFLPSFTPAEIRTVYEQIKDTVLEADEEKIDRYLKLSAAEDADFVRYLDYALGRLPAKALKDLGGFLDLIQCVTTSSPFC